MGNREDEAIQRAQQFIEASKFGESEKPIQLGVSFSTANELVTILGIDRIIEEALVEVTNLPDREGLTHPEHINNILGKRVKEALEQVDPSVGPDTLIVPLEFSEREVKHLNKQLLGFTSPLPLDVSAFPEGDKERYKKFIIEMNETGYRHAMSAFRDLNAAFIAGGGRPQKEYTKIFPEGV